MADSGQSDEYHNVVTAERGSWRHRPAHSMICDHSVASALLKSQPRKSHVSNKIGYFVFETMNTSLSVWFCYLVLVQSPSCESTSGYKGAVFGRTFIRQEEVFNGFRIWSHLTCSEQVKCTSGAIFFPGSLGRAGEDEAIQPHAGYDRCFTPLNAPLVALASLCFNPAGCHGRCEN